MAIEGIAVETVPDELVAAPNPLPKEPRAPLLTFNNVFRHYFGEHPPARACVESRMVVDCKVEVDCVAYKRPG